MYFFMICLPYFLIQLPQKPFFLNFEIVVNSNSCCNISIFYLINWIFAAETICWNTVANLDWQWLHLKLLLLSKGRYHLFAGLVVHRCWQIMIYGNLRNLKETKIREFLFYEIFLTPLILVEILTANLTVFINFRTRFWSRWVQKNRWRSEDCMPEWGEIVSKVNFLISYIFTRFFFNFQSWECSYDGLFLFHVYTKDSVIFYEMKGWNFWCTLGHTRIKKGWS